MSDKNESNDLQIVSSLRNQLAPFGTNDVLTQAVFRVWNYALIACNEMSKSNEILDSIDKLEAIKYDSNFKSTCSSRGIEITSIIKPILEIMHWIMANRVGLDEPKLSPFCKDVVEWILESKFVKKGYIKINDDLLKICEIQPINKGGSNISKTKTKNKNLSTTGEKNLSQNKDLFEK